MQHHDEPCALCEDDLAIMATAAGVLPVGSAMTPQLMEFVRTIVGHCASIGDRYKEEDGSAGDDIRAAFGLG